MKKFFENSKLAKFILFPNYLAITLGPWAFNKRTYDQECKNHECTHMRQWTEWTLLSSLIILIIIALTDSSPWWVLTSPLVYYILYIVEWVVRLFINGTSAYYHISFEKEAYDNESDNSYNTNSSYFSSLKYLFKK